MIGCISLNKVDDKSTRNLGFCIHSSHQCKGYATEDSRAMMAYARTALGLKHLISGTAMQNLFSARVLEKLGFVVTAEEKGSFISDAHGCAIVFDGLSLDCQL